MYESPFRKGIPWLIAGLLLLTLSTVLYIYDFELSNKELLSRVESKINSDFRECLDAYRQDGTPSEDLSHCHACQLSYSKINRLSSWQNKALLPTQKKVNRLGNIADEPIIQIDNRTYYQIRKKYEDSTSVILIPLRITYKVQNNLLPPFSFLGRSEKAFDQDSKRDYLQQLQVTIGRPKNIFEGDIFLRDEGGDIILTYSNMPVLPFRSLIRFAVLICLVLGGALLAVFLRMYALHKWEYRYFIDISLFVGVIAIRLIMHVTGLPGDYIDSKLFSPNILAFHALAPSLGELTINIFTFAILVWIAYMYFFRISNILYRKIIKNQYLAWPAMFTTLGISSYLLDMYIEVFKRISVNSSVDLDFFKADLYSFLILLDVGVLLLALGLVIFSLLKLNVLYGHRYGKSPYFLSFHLLAVLVINFLLHQSSPEIALVNSVGVLLLGLCVLRIPFKPILHQDLVNYLVMTMVFSLLVTYNLVVGVELNHQVDAQYIAERIIGNETSKIVVSFNAVTENVGNNQVEAEIQKDKMDMAEYEDWFIETFFKPSFEDFSYKISTYDYLEGKRLDPVAKNDVSLGPDADFPVTSIGEKIIDNLYQLPNDDSKNLDLYVGIFKVKFPAANDSIQFYVQFSPNSEGREGLYLPLSLDQVDYDNIKLIQSYDYGLYRQGLLYHKQGETTFPNLSGRI